MHSQPTAYCEHDETSECAKCREFDVYFDLATLTWDDANNLRFIRVNGLEMAVLDEMSDGDLQQYIFQHGTLAKEYFNELHAL